MCELFALSSNRSVKINFSWRGFKKRGVINRDGWGIAWYLNNRFAGLTKEPKPTVESSIARLMSEGVISRIVISHVRWASQGDISCVNTHPFVRRLWERDWVFAHNGDVSRIMGNSSYKLELYHPIGQTDSEYAFCYILERLSDSMNKKLDNLVYRLWILLEEIGRYGKFNILLSQGEYLFAYMNREETLYYLLRHPPHHGSAELIDEDYNVKIGEMKSHYEYAAIVATVPLTKEEWNPMKPGSLYVFNNGDLLLTVERGEIKLVLNKLEYDILKTIHKASHSVKFEDLKKVGLTREELREALQKLINKQLLLHNLNNSKESNHARMKYYTNPNFRTLIDKLLYL